MDSLWTGDLDIWTIYGRLCGGSMGGCLEVHEASFHVHFLSNCPDTLSILSSDGQSTFCYPLSKRGNGVVMLLIQWKAIPDVG